MRGPPRWRAQVAPGPAAGRGRRGSRPMPSSRCPAGPTLRPPIGTPAPAARTPRTASSTCWAPSARSGPTCQSPPRRHARGAAGRPRGPRGDHGALDRWSPGDDMRSAPQCSVRRRKRRRRRLSRHSPGRRSQNWPRLITWCALSGVSGRFAARPDTSPRPQRLVRARGCVGRSGSSRSRAHFRRKSRPRRRKMNTWCAPRRRMVYSWRTAHPPAAGTEGNGPEPRTAAQKARGPEPRTPARAGQRVSVTFEMDRGRSVSRPRARARW